LNTNSSTTVTLSGFKTYALLAVNTSQAAWVRIYSSTGAQSSDATRLQTTDPAPGIGLICEVITTGAATQLISPAVIGFSSEGTPVTNMPVTVTNLGVNGSVTVGITVLQLEK
jgi:hypothetical protein